MDRVKVVRPVPKVEWKTVVINGDDSEAFGALLEIKLNEMQGQGYGLVQMIHRENDGALVLMWQKTTAPSQEELEEAGLAVSRRTGGSAN